MSVSGTHAALLFVGGAWRLFDVGSTNGTQLGEDSDADDIVRAPPGDFSAAAGVALATGHDPAHLEGVRALVVSSAVPRDLPELQAARAAGLPVVTSRPRTSMDLEISSGRNADEKFVFNDSVVSTPTCSPR